MRSGGNKLVVSSILPIAYPEPGMELSILYPLCLVALGSAPLTLNFGV